ncbi:MAG: phospho-sugar mutase [Salinivirgaceae bacterium]|nr:phospho-sugar mutase [Salinivirgaceae bacterium]
MDQQLLQQVTETANKWLAMHNVDAQTKSEIERMINEKGDALIDSFYRTLEFGTGGLRGIMGVGSNRINVYTIAMATQGLCNYLKTEFADRNQISVAIAYDNRNNGKLFCQTVADIFTANGVKVYLFDSIRPTPELSFAIRYLRCQSGIVITASHNPKEYNGYKAYWEDGAQIIAPHDKNIINEVLKITSVDDINMKGNPDLMETIGEEIDQAYIEALQSLSLQPEVIERQSEMKIVYTPIHGTGVKLAPRALKAFGFKNVFNVPEQDVVDGNFPTVKSPNPEEPAALALALKKGIEVDADLIMATDPDADRVGIAVKNFKNEFVLFNGNQTATFLIYYLLKSWKEKGLLTGNEYLVKTIVTTEILPLLAKSFNVEIFDVLTGFKYIADIIGKNEGTKKFIGGGEESYGYLAGEFVRDKDAIMACALIAEAAAWAKDQGKSVFEMLVDIYVEYGMFYERLISITKKGKSGADAIEQLMVRFRTNPPAKINKSKLVCIKDYQKQESVDVLTGVKSKIDLPKSNVLQFILEDDSIVSIRPSGTEPKIKFYVGTRANLTSPSNYTRTVTRLDKRIEAILEDMNVE